MWGDHGRPRSAARALSLCFGAWRSCTQEVKAERVGTQVLEAEEKKVIPCIIPEWLKTL